MPYLGWLGFAIYLCLFEWMEFPRQAKDGGDDRDDGGKDKVHR
jgi:hypothetical protein